ncbi:MAG: hypothetical protein JSR85_03305 [Proteobacteria bacterium]|nr:hypothetical protein [Pseudomonadota bacterium]
MSKKFFQIALLGFTFIPAIANADQDCFEKCDTSYTICKTGVSDWLANCQRGCTDNACQTGCTDTARQKTNRCTNTYNGCSEACPKG